MHSPNFLSLLCLLSGKHNRSAANQLIRFGNNQLASAPDIAYSLYVIHQLWAFYSPRTLLIGTTLCLSTNALSSLLTKFQCYFSLGKLPALITLRFSTLSFSVLQVFSIVHLSSTFPSAMQTCFQSLNLQASSLYQSTAT